MLRMLGLFFQPLGAATGCAWLDRVAVWVSLPNGSQQQLLGNRVMRRAVFCALLCALAACQAARAPDDQAALQSELRALRGELVALREDVLNAHLEINVARVNTLSVLRNVCSSLRSSEERAQCMAEWDFDNAMRKASREELSQRQIQQVKREIHGTR